jgi:hypothetical protein
VKSEEEWKEVRFASVFAISSGFMVLLTNSVMDYSYVHGMQHRLIRGMASLAVSQDPAPPCSSPI